MAINFDEASAATEALFADNQTQAQQPEQQTAEQANESTENQPVAAEKPASSQQAMLADAVNTAEVAAQTAAQTSQELEMLKQQNTMLQEQNEQLQGTIEEISKQNEQNIIEAVLEPPTLDVNALAFADEDTVRAAQADYAAKMAEFAKKQMMQELSPVLEYAKAGMHEKEKNEAISALSQIPELSGISDMLPQLDRIIANNKWLQSDDMPMDEKYINAFAIAKGVNSINNPPTPATEPSAEELMNYYNSNPEFQELVEKQRLSEIKQSQQVPPFSASSGAVNAALNIKPKPQTLEEASKRTREMFGAE